MKNLLFLIILIATTGCGLIAHGTKQNVVLDSNPRGVIVTDGKHLWTTPVTVSLPRKYDHTLIFFKQGYIAQSIQIKRKLSPVVAGYILPGGVAFAAIDIATGSEWQLTPDHVTVELEKR